MFWASHKSGRPPATIGSSSDSARAAAHPKSTYLGHRGTCGEQQRCRRVGWRSRWLQQPDGLSVLGPAEQLLLQRPLFDVPGQQQIGQVLRAQFIFALQPLQGRLPPRNPAAKIVQQVLLQDVSDGGTSQQRTEKTRFQSRNEPNCARLMSTTTIASH